jgi:hypothetical protein
MEACETCAPGSGSTADCLCVDGFFRQPGPGVCVPCPVCTFRDSTQDVCTQCAAGYSTQGITSTSKEACVLCPTCQMKQ